ncbi:MAG: hypothetical protein HC919_10435 [Oscillatoriales cyanobacterium SM2_2_1]|nr:hypothetical protein [Oscillatoriales cyanobacterium SM2_2_1]
MRQFESLEISPEAGWVVSFLFEITIFLELLLYIGLMVKTALGISALHGDCVEGDRYGS